METRLELFKRAFCRLEERGFFPEHVVPSLFLGCRDLNGRFLDPFNRRCKPGMVLEGSDKIGLIKIGRVDDPEEQWLEDMMPFSAHSSATSQSGSAEVGCDGQDNLGDGKRQRHGAEYCGRCGCRHWCPTL